MKPWFEYPIEWEMNYGSEFKHLFFLRYFDERTLVMLPGKKMKYTGTSTAHVKREDTGEFHYLFWFPKEQKRKIEQYLVKKPTDSTIKDGASRTYRIQLAPKFETSALEMLSSPKLDAIELVMEGGLPLFRGPRCFQKKVLILNGILSSYNCSEEATLYNIGEKLADKILWTIFQLSEDAM